MSSPELHKIPESEPFPYVICSRPVDKSGLPVNDCHMLWESAQTEAHAKMYAMKRAKEGRWVEVFKTLYYHAPGANG